MFGVSSCFPEEYILAIASLASVDFFNVESSRVLIVCAPPEDRGDLFPFGFFARQEPFFKDPKELRRFTLESSAISSCLGDFGGADGESEFPNGLLVGTANNIYQ